MERDGTEESIIIFFIRGLCLPKHNAKEGSAFFNLELKDNYLVFLELVLSDG